ncbi:hypothetical protein SLU01_20810 [Sporosarcina luteola]|uniref:Uncharacterized protein n=1 Tax=Sporosarcina luteola TaxID=582850 RepID=A0A511Z8J5_9BACL|nr:hypothetical protein SLU01_20810 [Sporosarcina luteola]
MEWKAATPAGTARAEDPGLSKAKEAAEVVPAESVRLERKSTRVVSTYKDFRKEYNKNGLL